MNSKPIPNTVPELVEGRSLCFDKLSNHRRATIFTVPEPVLRQAQQPSKGSNPRRATIFTAPEPVLRQAQQPSKGRLTVPEPVEGPQPPIKIVTTAYTYILQCANGEYYVGSTTDLDKRLQEHQAGLGAKFTRTHLPVKLVYYEEYASITQAFARERQLHGWSRAKKEALIKGDLDQLRSLSGHPDGP